MEIAGNELLKQAIDILNLTKTICELLLTDDHAEITKQLMLENGVIIKVNICRLNARLWSCNAFHKIDQKYLDVLQDEIESFRKIFIQWVGAFLISKMICPMHGTYLMRLHHSRQMMNHSMPGP